MQSSEECSYDAICSLARLFEKEVEMMRMINKRIRAYSMSKKGKQRQKGLLEVADLFKAMDVLDKGSVSKKQ